MVEDNPVDARVLESALKTQTDTDRAFEITRAGDLASGLERVAGEKKFDIALLDLALPDAYGLEVVERIQEDAPELPLIVLTGRNDDILATIAVATGAQDYLVKGSFDRSELVRTIAYAIERKGLQLQRLASKDRFVSLVSHELRNPLTVIFATLEMLAQRVELDPTSDKLLQLARKNTKQPSAARSSCRESSRSLSPTYTWMPTGCVRFSSTSRPTPSNTPKSTAL